MNRHELLKQPIERAIEIINNLVSLDNKITIHDINYGLDAMSIVPGAARSKMISKIADHYYDKKRLEWEFSDRPSKVFNDSYRTEAMAPKEDDE